MDEYISKRVENERTDNDLKQHADKIIQSLEKLDQSSMKRAIWELFQNAADLSKNCEIVIEQKPDRFIFKHNGKPFTTKTLDCLIIQVSSKGNDNNNDDDIGKYGTGFLTTHSFGKIFYLSGSVDLENNKDFINFKDLIIDRTSENSDSNEMINKLKLQRENVNVILNNEKNEEKEKWTVFSYLTETNFEKENAKDAISCLPTLLPYVMAINEGIKNVTVIDINGINTFYKKENCFVENSIINTPIKINNDIKNVYSINTDDLTIILPLQEKNIAIKFHKDIPKLFISFPLIGTENFGFNYIVHSKKFYSTESRDNIHLQSDNPQISKKEKENRELLTKVFENISGFVTNNYKNITNRQYLSIINFKNRIHDNHHLSNYFKEIKNKWFNFFKTIPLVERKNDLLEPINTLFIDRELLKIPKYYDAIYNVVNIFYTNIPNKNIAVDWTDIVIRWEDKNTDDDKLEIKFITIENLLEEIQNEKTIDVFIKNDKIQDLQKFYEYLIKIDKSSEFIEYSILPNIKNELKNQNELVTHQDIENILIEIADIIIPDIPKKFIHNDFKFNLEFNNYNKKDYSRDINQALTKYSIDIETDEKLPENIFKSLVSYCTIFNSSQDKSNRRKLVTLICNYIKKEDNIIEIIGTTQEIIEWRTPEKYLLKNFIFILNKAEIDIHKFYELLSILYEWKEVDEILVTMPLFPDQNNIIRKINDLEIDGGIPEEIKELYDVIIHEDSEETIKSKLLNNEKDFSSFVRNKKTKTTENLSRDIEEKIHERHPILDINNHPYKNEILKIIKNIKSIDKWDKYFPQINSKKQEIFFVAFDDEDTKDFIFDLISNKDRTDIIRKIYNIDNLEEIMELGIKALENNKIASYHWEHKKEIGKKIEDIIRERIGKEIDAKPVETKNKQNGQDIIIFYESREVYYIEVKSRWAKDTSISMSSVQMKSAIEHKESYALVYVDMSDYNKFDRYTPSFEKINDRIKIIPNIGYKVKHLETVFELENKEKEVYLVNYRGHISQEMIKQEGISFNEFIEILICNLKKIKE